MDILTPAERSLLMGRVRGKDSRPEMAVRRLVHAMGYRYRLHVSKLPGRPDLVFAKRRKIIFVHGCYWHRHDCTKGRQVPSTQTEFWQKKFESNVSRDRKNLKLLIDCGWDVLVVWECDIRDQDKFRGKLSTFLLD